MKLKIATVILFLICIVLGFMLVQRQKETRELQEATDATTAALTFASNQWKKASDDLATQEKVTASLGNTVKTREAEVAALSNKLTEAKAQIEKTEADAKAKEQAAQAELAKRDAKINELEGQRDDLGKRMAALTNTLAGLQRQISETERKLSVSEGDREFLLKELKRLQTEKVELERQFNDLKLLKAQVNKLKDELTIARRLDFIRAGVFGGLKGAEMLMRKTPPGPPAGSTNFNLNVEFKQDSGARVLPPATNAPVPAPQ
jgi:chromosome segregation ATPase